MKDAKSQSISGSWQGVMGHEIIQINIKEERGRICGYTYDYFISNKAEYCKAYFSGRYDENRGAWILTGVSFIENSGSHVLMRLLLFREEYAASNLLSAIVSTETRSIFQETMGEKVYLKRISRTPAPLDGGLPPCFPEETNKPIPRIKKVQPVIKKPIPNPAPVPAPVIKKQTPVVSKPDTAKPVIKPPAPVIQKTEPAKKVTNRKRNSISRLEVSVKNITLDVYDNGIIDGDTVSIYYNGRLLVDKKVLSAKPLTLKLELSETNTANEIIMYAENLGSIPPNTALIVVTAGDKRYELHASANLQENAVLVFDYKPR